MVLCAGAFGCYAAQGSLPGAQGQGYDLNLSYSRTTLKAVADAITQQAGIAFSYETALAGYPMENLEVSEKGATIEAILAAVFTPRGIDYRVVDKVVVLTRSTRPVPAASAAAKSEVKGVVRDAAGNPMIGVTVTIKGTLVGVSTGVDGGYAIPADGNATLLFSYIGYRPHEEVVGRRTQIDVTMQEDELVMDEVVVVGYGTLKKRNIVGAVENLSGDAVENRPNANITRSLQGQIPGLNIVQVDGKADHAGEVTIRGVNNTFKARVSGGEKTNKLGQGGGALVLIDGAEGDMGSVNIADRHDFVLTPLPAPESDFTLVCIADPQCATTAEISRYVNETIPDVEATVDGYKAKGTPVYGITLGDIVFDTPDLWSNMKESMANRNLPIFQTIGNHDHLQTETSDDNAAANFETQFGPRNYSFNRGDVHIVSMDNVLYEGKKKYKGGITDKQLEWLRQDLSHVDKDKLVIFCAHIPFRGGTSVTDESHENYDGVLDLLSGFSEAHIMIGHTHYHQKYIHKRNGKTILEHVHGAACGAWWTANICADGTPNGYSVYEISGNTIANQYYKSTNKEAGYQIRAYSATQVFGKSGSLTFGWAANAPAMNDAKCIVANVWNSDASGNWKVSLWQNGTKVCDMTRVKTYDYWAYAYHVLYYSKSVGTTWGKNLDHYYYGNLASGTPETADFEIVAEDGMGNTYRTSKLQTDFIGF